MTLAPGVLALAVLAWACLSVRAVDRALEGY